ncbi:MAG: M1 family metallopeptidase [Chloroflexi bacterium]|nr:M1 family metallopeptidase [Chloroflexota bacterium]
MPHELAHQWFYSQVGNNHALEPWLDEALATYSEVLFYEHYYPDLDQWWWDNRVYAHPHSGFVDNSIYDAGTYDNYRASVYLHGAIFLHDLRITMGDGAFMSALKSYIDQNNMGIAGKNDFLAVFQAANPDADIQAVFARYFME